MQTLEQFFEPLYTVTMGKYNHICELIGADNYPQWKKQMTLTLQGECLWSHCSSGNDPQNFTDFASHIPKPADPATIKESEKEKILDWLAKDVQAKALIDRKISIVVVSLLNEQQTAREQWDVLANHYGHTDILSQYQLRAHVRLEKLKDAEDASHYVGVFEDARHRFLQMGVSYTTDESVFDLLQGLPDGIEWEIFRKFTMNTPSLNSTSSTLVSSSTTSSSMSPPSPPSSFTFTDASKLLLEKANAIVGCRKLVGPGSEYANVAVKPGKTNPSMGVRIHKNNPSGIHCTNPPCNGKPQAETHDKEHCYWPGSGMEAQAPAWARPCNPKTESAAMAKVEQTLPSPSETPQIICRELSCTVITELDPYSELVALASPGPFATILDSGATSHLIKDRGYFVDFATEDRLPVKTANQGTLQMSGHGSCVVELTLNADTYRIVLKDCLHAPGALLNISKPLVFSQS